MQRILNLYLEFCNRDREAKNSLLLIIIIILKKKKKLQRMLLSQVGKAASLELIK
jgi:hypothetical protein